MVPIPDDEVVGDPEDPQSRSFTAFRSTAEESEIKRDQRGVDDEGGHMSSTGGRVMRVPGSKLPYIVTLSHHLSDATRHLFATMREAEAFIKRNTPVPRALLSTIYDRPASESQAPTSKSESAADDEIVRRLKSIDKRLRQYSADEAALIMSAALAGAGMSRQERLRLVTSAERALDEHGRQA